MDEPKKLLLELRLIEPEQGKQGIGSLKPLTTVGALVTTNDLKVINNLGEGTISPRLLHALKHILFFMEDNASTLKDTTEISEALFTRFIGMVQANRMKMISYAATRPTDMKDEFYITFRVKEGKA